MSRSLVIVSVLGIEIRRFKSCHPDKNVKNFMLKTNFKSQDKSLNYLKSSLVCYGISENRFFESEVKLNNDSIIFDFGHKHKLKTFDLNLQSKESDFVISKIKNFETPYNEILIDFEAYRKIQINNELFKLLKENFESKSFFKGRLLNSSKKGFSIGVCGIVGFLSTNNAVKIKKDKTAILCIDSLNLNQGIISFSQKNIHKKTHKVLFKLASRIMFIFESNVKFK